MNTIKLTIEYDGTDYAGWQIQPNGLSVQECIETALSEVLGERVPVVSSGRTDAGVHARGMVAHFQTAAERPLSAYREGVNSHLPADIAITAAESAAAGFHARYSALAKTYRYTICQGDVRSPILHRYSWHIRRPLDLESMNEAAAQLVGEYDFSAFRSSGCDARTTVRTIYAARFRRHGRQLHFDVTGSGFLRNMVRVIVGTLVEVGTGKRSPVTLTELLQGGERGLSGVTAPPQGLCLERVWYDGTPDDWASGRKHCKMCQKKS